MARMTDKEMEKALHECEWDLIEIKKMEKMLKEIDEEEVQDGNSKI